MGTRGRVDTSPVAQGCPRGLKLRVQYESHTSDAGRLLAQNSERHMKSAWEMSRLVADMPEAIANTREISTRLDFTLADLGYELPRYPVPPGETMMSFLRQRADEGARLRYRPYH